MPAASATERFATCVTILRKRYTDGETVNDENSIVTGYQRAGRAAKLSAVLPGLRRAADRDSCEVTVHAMSYNLRDVLRGGTGLIWYRYTIRPVANAVNQHVETPASSRRAAATTGCGQDQTRKNIASRTARSAK
jgi:hypothetical protein